MDYTAITGAVDFATLLTAVGTVAVSVAGLLLAVRGARVLLAFIRK